MGRQSEKLDAQVEATLKSRGIVSDESVLASWKSAAKQQNISLVSFLRMHHSLDSKMLDEIVKIASDVVNPHLYDTEMRNFNDQSVIGEVGGDSSKKPAAKRDTILE